MDTAKRLRQYNRWRRGLNDWDTEEGSPNPEELGKLIDQAVTEIEAAQLLYEAAENLRKQKGRHNTAIAYHRLTEALSSYKLRTAMPANAIAQGREHSERPAGAEG